MEIKDIVYLAIVALNFLFTIVKVHNARKQVTHLETLLENNKQNQISEEKDMAKFLCDKCGKEIEVKDARQVRNWDLCPACADEVMHKLDNVTELEGRKETAKTQVTTAINDLLARLTNGELISAALDTVKTFAEIYDHCTSAELENNDVLNKLGLK